MNTLHISLKLLLCLPLLLLDGCSDSTAAQAPAAVSQQTLAAVARGRVDVEGGVISIAAARPGIVRTVLVEEGAEVQAGQLLARIDDGEAQLQLGLRQRERDEIRQAMALSRVRLQAAEREAQRFNRADYASVVSAQQRDQALDQVRLLQAELAQQQSSLASAEQRIRAAEHEVAQHQVRAPANGRIVKRQARPGDGASTLNVTPLFQLAPSGPRIIRAELEERFVQQVKAGQGAEVSIDADDAQRYKARVLRLGEVFGMRSNGDEPGEKVDVRVIECVLQLDDSPLRIGQRVLVRFGG